jgi:N4-gp56 family major capsid protein
MTTIGDLQFDQAAYNLVVDYAFRPQNYFDQCASVRPSAQSFPGTSVIFPIVSDLPIQSTSIDESTDVTPQVMADTTVSVTLSEYGAAVKTSAKMRGTSYIVPFDPVVAEVIGYNAGASIDVIARNALTAGTASVAYGVGTSRATVTPAGVLTSAMVRQSTTFLRRNNTPTIGGAYIGYIHPDVSYDLRSESSGSSGLGQNANWRDPHVYSDPGAIWNGEIGMYEGVRFIEASRSRIFSDAGSSTTNTDVYATIILGAQAMAKAYSYTDGNGPEPRVFPGPVTDTLRRFVPMGWYFLGGYHLYRDATGVGFSTRRLETSSSVGLNTASGTNDPTNNANV